MKKKTHLLSIVTFSTSVLHVILSYVFINLFGTIGAAYASLISFFVSFLYVWRLSAQVYELPWFSKDILITNETKGE